MTKAQFVNDFIGTVLGDAISIKRKLTAIVEKLFDIFQPVVVTLTDNYTLTAEDTNKVFLIATDAKVITLPSTVAGLKYTIINSGAAGNNIVTISPQAADGISGTITLAATVVVDAGVVNKDLINTKATSKCGDNVVLIGTGVAGTSAWIIQSSTGIWAAE